MKQPHLGTSLKTDLRVTMYIGSPQMRTVLDFRKISGRCWACHGSSLALIFHSKEANQTFNGGISKQLLSLNCSSKICTSEVLRGEVLVPEIFRCHRTQRGSWQTAQATSLKESIHQTREALKHEVSKTTSLAEIHSTSHVSPWSLLQYSGIGRPPHAR